MNHYHERDILITEIRGLDPRDLVKLAAKYAHYRILPEEEREKYLHAISHESITHKNIIQQVHRIEGIYQERNSTDYHRITGLNGTTPLVGYFLATLAHMQGVLADVNAHLNPDDYC